MLAPSLLLRIAGRAAVVTHVVGHGAETTNLLIEVFVLHANGLLRLKCVKCLQGDRFLGRHALGRGWALIAVLLLLSVLEVRKVFVFGISGQYFEILISC
jgi:hypothetical protein